MMRKMMEKIYVTTILEISNNQDEISILLMLVGQYPIMW